MAELSDNKKSKRLREFRLYDGVRVTDVKYEKLEADNEQPEDTMDKSKEYLSLLALSLGMLLLYHWLSS